MTGFDRIRAVAEAGGLSGLRLGILIEQDHIQQRLVNLDAIVVFDKAEFAKSIHEKLTRERVVPINSATAFCEVSERAQIPFR